VAYFQWPLNQHNAHFFPSGLSGHLSTVQLPPVTINLPQHLKSGEYIQKNSNFCSRLIMTNIFLTTTLHKNALAGFDLTTNKATANLTTQPRQRFFSSNVSAYCSQYILTLDDRSSMYVCMYVCM
jgi:hypothetical protein